LVLVIVKDGNPFDDGGGSNASRCEDALAADAKYASQANAVPLLESGTTAEREANRKARAAASSALEKRGNVIVQNPECFKAADVASAKQFLDQKARQ